MAQEIFKQVNFNAGEIDPRTEARSDLKLYYAALELAENLVTTPVGPIVRRPGTEFVGVARHVLEAVPFVGGDVAAPEGGTAAKIVDADGDLLKTTTPLGAADMVLLQIDFGAPVDIAVLDLIDFAAVDPAAVTPATPPVFAYPFPNANYIPADGFGIFQDP